MVQIWLGKGLDDLLNKLLLFMEFGFGFEAGLCLYATLGNWLLFLFGFWEDGRFELLKTGV